MVIKRRISFDFLGEAYKDAYGIFASIPISQYKEISETIDVQDNSIKKTGMMLELIKKKFVSGKFPDDEGELKDLKVEDLDDADGELLLTIYNRLMGGPDPKVTMPS